MLGKDIRQGGVYIAKVSGKLTKVRVDDIDTHALVGYGGGGIRRHGTRYHCTNLATNRSIVVKSAAKFRNEVKQTPAQPLLKGLTSEENNAAS